MEEIKKLVLEALKYEEESYMPHYGTLDVLRRLVYIFEHEERTDNEEVSK